MAEQSRGVHLTQVHPHPEDNTETDVDIIAIHGLDTKSPDTWVWTSKHPGERSVNWLADSHMLPREVGSARIFTCDWQADLFQSSDMIPMVLEEITRHLLHGIEGRPSAPNDQPGREPRPILFIASCLGGIILMKALSLADPNNCVRRATRGILFLATPFRGTAFQDVAIWAKPGLKTWATVRGKEVTPLLDNVTTSTFDLRELVRKFTQLCKDNAPPFLVFNFYETGKTNLYHRIPLARYFPPRLLARKAKPSTKPRRP
ncbi:hypothetical protein QQX98_003146 [Neonectria punicea]|uniref:DUF676 domain-containing protein n=1 Tax=Neonectria punicea TaxID=979145 RepID=A0ABR1HFI3_9HYPO